MPHVGWLCGAGSVGRTFVMPSRADQIRIQGSAKFIRMMLGVLYACSTIPTSSPRTFWPVFPVVLSWRRRRHFFHHLIGACALSPDTVITRVFPISGHCASDVYLLPHLPIPPSTLHVLVSQN